MRFGSFAALALIPVALATNNAGAIINNVHRISSDIVALNDTLNTFKASDLLSLFTALKIQQQVGTLGDDLVVATNLTRQSSAFTQTQSGNIANAVVALEPQIKTLLANIVQHKPAFASALLLVGDLSKTVEADLKAQKKQTRMFSAALVAKLAEPYAGLAPVITKPILKYFTQAIHQYTTCTGTVCLPAIG